MRLRPLILVGATTTGCTPPVTRVIVQDGDTIVTIESSDCCCDDNSCCDGDGGDDGDDDVGDDGGDDATTDTTDTGDVVEPEDCTELAAPDAVEPTLTESCDGPATASELTWEPEVEWSWSPSTDTHYFNQVMMTPTVGNLTDDNGDGVIDASDTPDVAFIAYGENLYSAGEAGVLVILDGATGAELYYGGLILSGGGAYKDYAAATGGVALAEVNGDGRPDACFPTAAGQMVCLDANGETAFDAVKASTIPFKAHVAGYPAIGDLNADGQAEIVMGSFTWYYGGSSGAAGEDGVGAAYVGGTDAVSANSVLADLDGDGLLEIVAGNSVYDYEGKTIWTDTSAKDGVSAVADLDLDGSPEVVTVAIGIAYVFASDGTLTQAFNLDYCTTGNTCGTPTIADFNGDGIPDIGVAGNERYAVYTDSGSGYTELWSNTINDSSGSTGASVFDFEDDGIHEVVFADEGQLYIWRGTDGSDLLRGSSFDGSQHSNGTLFGMPVVADVDNDGESEIIIASNNLYDGSGWSGVRSIGSGSGDAWAPSRPVWNQHSYHISNIEDDLSVPTTEPQHWLEHNNFRVADESEAPPSPKEDLADLQTQEGHEVCFDCENDEATFYLRVANAGQGDAEATELSFMNDGVELARFEVDALAAGASTVVGPFTVSIADWTGGVLDAVIDPDGAVEECDTDNNLSSSMDQTWTNECL